MNTIQWTDLEFANHFQMEIVCKRDFVTTGANNSVVRIWRKFEVLNKPISYFWNDSQTYKTFFSNILAHDKRNECADWWKVRNLVH